MVFVKNAAKIQQKFDIRKCFGKFIFFVNIVLQIIYFYCLFLAFLSYFAHIKNPTFRQGCVGL